MWYVYPEEKDKSKEERKYDNLSCTCEVEAQVFANITLCNLLNIDISTGSQQEHLSFYETDDPIEEGTFHFVLGADLDPATAAAKLTQQEGHKGVKWRYEDKNQDRTCVDNEVWWLIPTCLKVNINSITILDSEDSTIYRLHVDYLKFQVLQQSSRHTFSRGNEEEIYQNDMYYDL